ncbi:MAG: glycosyltransferase [Pirellulaceae bacterium]|jgi:sugar transferase (PEP-CTERM/EpsH1 system associated)|nr:glycosyltransferase [Pirellulaceae bacterium]
MPHVDIDRDHRRRVVHVVNSFETGGMEKGVATLIRHSVDVVDHVLVCLTHTGETGRLLPSGTRVIEMNKPPGNSVSFLVKLARLLRGLRPCVVHTRNWPGMDGVIAARVAGIRELVHGEHGLGSDDPTGLDARRLRVRRALKSWPMEYTCVSRTLEQWLVDAVRVSRPVTRITNGVDTDLYRPGSGAAARAELGVDSGAFVVGVIGRLDPIKDHDTLLAAHRRLRAALPGAVVLVVGDGPERPRLMASAPQGVRFLGNRSDIPALLRALDVFVLPSINEGISNTILEAMASGVPVVASRVGGSPELVEDGVTGRLFPVGDIDALTVLLQAYAASPELAARHGTLGRRRAEQDFSIDTMVMAYRRVWDRVGR